MNEPYEHFHSPSTIVGATELDHLPSMVKPGIGVVVKAALSSPNYIITANADGSISWWSLETLSIELTLMCTGECPQDLIIWDDDNILLVDVGGTIVWVHRNDNGGWEIVYKLNIGHPALGACRVGMDQLVLCSSDGTICIVVLRSDGYTMVKESEV
jgi:hypothetical protein